MTGCEAEAWTVVRCVFPNRSYCFHIGKAARMWCALYKRRRVASGVPRLIAFYFEVRPRRGDRPDKKEDATGAIGSIWRRDVNGRESASIVDDVALVLLGPRGVRGAGEVSGDVRPKLYTSSAQPPLMKIRFVGHMLVSHASQQDEDIVRHHSYRTKKTNKPHLSINDSINPSIPNLSLTLPRDDQGVPRRRQQLTLFRPSVTNFRFWLGKFEGTATWDA
ncbi:hypothetical protein P691DRAFT_791598 [Macrolepiota fuliginosa MF-IS2]|uniref:Uncharacterized protein n=1 Tax=Macrolepiota fuliginosa MF-IS2 TaxID=1400762 RepID=A0A9P5XNM6_9AGAR|nr:hypothetical protein P691DRAFT_791598 [Macrolepiota fuliginosa MF-IS2]